MSQPHVLPLAAGINSRYSSLTVDARLINCFVEKTETEKELHVYKRPGFVEVSTIAAGTARGLTTWNDHIYAVIDGKLYKDGVLISSTLNNAGTYTFAPTMGTAKKLFLHNSTKAYAVTTADIVTDVGAADADYPATTVPGCAYLDGTVYVMTADAVIAGSAAAANDPTSWNPLEQIAAQLEPTPGVALSKQLAHIIAFKEGNTEFFYDAGNSSGSVLARIPGAKINLGCLSAATVKDLGGDLMWVADTGEGAVCAALMSSLRAEPVSTPAIERILSALDYTTIYSWALRIEGHRFYGLTSTVSNITLVYDVMEKIWYQWQSPTGGYLPYAFSTLDVTGTRTLFLHESNGKLYTPQATTFQDAGTTFPVHIYTPNFDGGTWREKTLARLDVLGDRVVTSLSLEFSDDDYSTWTSGGTTQLDLARPGFADLGSFYRRAFHFSHSDNTALRIRGMEVLLGMGVD